MKKLMLLAAGIAMSALIVLAGCTAAQQQNVAALAANAQAQVKNACGIVQPVLVDLSATVPTDANLALAVKDNAQFCGAVAGLDASNVQTLIGTLIPEEIGLVGLLPIDSATQQAIQLALGAASLALSNWLNVYGAPASTAAPASGASAAAPASAAAASSPLVVAASQ